MWIVFRDENRCAPLKVEWDEVNFDPVRKSDVAALVTPGADYDQADSGDQCDRAEDGRDGESVLRLVRNLQRSRIDNFLLVGEGDSAGSVSDDAENDEEYSDDGCCLHEEEPFVRYRISDLI